MRSYSRQRRRFAALQVSPREAQYLSSEAIQGEQRESLREIPAGKQYCRSDLACRPVGNALLRVEHWSARVKVYTTPDLGKGFSKGKAKATDDAK